ncbi:MAG: hypothetical protein Q3996_00845 [Candidatus Saccharibacteria bacterium]|nr:hypothetical protein [Candidatus Saccharibacteria bacterium]
MTDKDTSNLIKQFDGQRSDEQVILLFRKKYTVLMWPSVQALVLLAVMLWLMMQINKQFQIIIILAMVLVLIWLVHKIITWYYSFYILTNQRLRYIQRYGISKGSLLDLPINSIKVARYFSDGLLSEILHYGDIIIEADGGELTMSKVDHAKDVYNQIQDLINQNRG